MISRRALFGGGAAIAARALPAWAATGGSGVARVSLPGLPSGEVRSESTLGPVWAQLLTTSCLLDMTPEGRISGGLAIAWGFSPDRTRLDLEVRLDALFADATPIIPDDVVASFTDARDWYAGSPDAWRWEHVESVEIVPGGIVSIMMSEPDASFPALLASHLVPVRPAGWIARGWDREVGPFPPASGPFHLETAAPDRRRYIRNDGFFQVGRPRLAAVLCTSATGTVSRTTELVTNDIDLLIDAPLLDVPVMREDPGIVLVGGPTNRLCYLAVNLRSDAVADVRLRRLLSSAIDRAGLVQAATAAEAVPASVLVPTGHWAGLEQATETADPDDVREELAALGKPPGLELRLVANSAEASLANACVLLQEQLAWAGVALSLDLLDDAEMAAEMEGGAWDLVMSCTGYWRDPHELIRPLVVSDGSSNIGGYRSNRVDYLADLARRARGLDYRADLYRAIQEVVLDDVPVIPLYFPNYYDAMNPKLRNYPFVPPVSVAAMRQVMISRPEPAVRP